MEKNLISKIIKDNLNKIDRAILDLSYAKTQSNGSAFYSICSAEEKLLSAKRNLLSLSTKINLSTENIEENDETINV